MAEPSKVLEMLSDVARHKEPTSNERVSSGHDAMGGMLEAGNIDLKRRPRVKNADGSISTVRSMSSNIDGKEVLMPTVSDDGRIMSDQEAIDTYHRTGRHLGKFDKPENATAYAEKLHQDQERMYAPPPPRQPATKLGDIE